MANVVEIEAFSFLKQEITWQLIIVSHLQNRSPLAASVIDQVIDQFSHRLETSVSERSL